VVAIRVGGGGGGGDGGCRVHAAVVDAESPRSTSTGRRRADVQSRCRHSEAAAAAGHIEAVADARRGRVDVASLRSQLLFTSPLRASVGKPHLPYREHSAQHTGFFSF